MNDRRGQIAIFVIVGILMVAAIASLFIINRKPTAPRGLDFDNPESYLDNCVRNRTKTVVDEMLAGGGFIGANDTALYKGNKVTYLCKNINYYQPCINQHPIYLPSLEIEFKNEITTGVSQCFASLEQQLVKKNYAVDGGPFTLNVTFKPGVVNLRILRDFSISRGGSARSYKGFDIYTPSPIYDLAFVANEIVAQEARWCHFSNNGFMALYHDYDIRVDRLGDSTKIYTIMYKETKDTLIMATRGCAIPAGF